MKAKEWPVLEMAIESGVSYGWARAHKHTEDPSPDHIKMVIAECVMSKICEWFDMDIDEDD